MLLQIFFGTHERLGDIIDVIRTKCTITPNNAPSVPITKEPDGSWYFGLQVSLTIDQLRDIIKNTGMDLNVVGGLNEQAKTFLVLNEEEKQFELYSIFVLEFKNNKMTMMANRVQTWEIDKK